MKRKFSSGKNIFIIILIVLICTIFFSSTSNGGKSGHYWENPAERYLNEYKKYLNGPDHISESTIKHFVYFACDRDAIHDNPFLTIERFGGAQIMYSWKQLEPEKGVYDFSNIEDDIKYLKLYGKKLFIQLQDASFSVKRIPVPDYLLSDEYAGGAVYQRDDNDNPEGWVAKRWNKNVQERFSMLLKELGSRFDGVIEGINFQESAIGISKKFVSDFSDTLYVESLKRNMFSLKKSFPKSTTMQYANFMPGEWLPWEDNGYLKSIYKYGEEIGVGLGAPDLMPTRKGQLNHALAMMHESDYTVPLGIAVQDGNYIGETNNDDIKKDRESMVPMLHDFAEGFLKVNYMFWVYQEPYFSEDVIPYFQ